jgi:hypothetical protein
MILRRCAALAVALLVFATVGAAASVKLHTLAGPLVDPLELSPARTATVLLFISTECPYSNRSAPEIQRVMARFQPKGVRFWLIYPNGIETPAIIRAHLKDFGYPDIALRDPDHALVKIAHPQVTPEAAVFNKSGMLTYRGRIDDRFVSLGKERPAPTKRDLEDALTATLAGKPVPTPITQAFGCYIGDMQ